jgi:hypothetical protein
MRALTRSDFAVSPVSSLAPPYPPLDDGDRPGGSGRPSWRHARAILGGEDIEEVALFRLAGHDGSSLSPPLRKFS